MSVSQREASRIDQQRRIQERFAKFVKRVHEDGETQMEIWRQAINGLPLWKRLLVAWSVIKGAL